MTVKKFPGPSFSLLRARSCAPFKLAKVKLRAVLGDFGIVGLVIADKLDDAPRGSGGSIPTAYAPSDDHEVLYQVLSPHGQVWQTIYVGTADGDPSGVVVATNLQGPQGSYPGMQVRAVARRGRLIDIRSS